jgi:hypothetical protein
MPNDRDARKPPRAVPARSAELDQTILVRSAFASRRRDRATVHPASCSLSDQRPRALDGVHKGGRICEVRFAKLLAPLEVRVQHAEDTLEERERLHARVP